MHNSFFRRLSPFLRRDLRARLSWACATLLLLVGLTALGVAALTRTDSPDAQRVRVALGLEHPHAVCGGPGGPDCLYDDAAEAKVERERARARELRLAVLDELASRTSDGLEQLPLFTETRPSDWLHRDLFPRDVSPIPMRSVERRMTALFDAYGRGCTQAVLPSFDGIGWMKCTSGVAEEVARQRDELSQAAALIGQLRMRDDAPSTEPGIHEVSSRRTLEVLASARRDHLGSSAAHAAHALRQWIGSGHPPHARTGHVAQSLARVIETASADELIVLANAVTDPHAELWGHGLLRPSAAIPLEAVRYRSPIATRDAARLFALGLFGLSALFLLVVGPSVTATSAARERESGTLPVLRMTGLSPGDLAWAMIAGPNVYAWTVGVGLLLVALPLLVGAHALDAMTAAGLLVVVAAMTHATALGLGFAASRKLPAWALGATAATLLTMGGCIGSLWLLTNLGHTGLLLGPIPAVFDTAMRIWSPRETSISTLESSLLIYTLGGQALLAGLCLLSWRRRVEQSWMPIFRPLEGVLLGALAVGCGALATIDMSTAANVTTYDEVNLIVAVAAVFTLPVIGWALVSSLVRPARSATAISAREARHAFGRFQLLLAGTGFALAAAYAHVVSTSQLHAEPAQTMWLTLGHVVLVTQTAAATLLLAARHPNGRHRILMLGGVIGVAQLAFTVSAYRLERELVALGHGAGAALRDASAYWLVFLVLLWAAGLGLVLAALLREHDRKQAEEAAESSDDADDDEGSGKPNRWLH